MANTVTALPEHFTLLDRVRAEPPHWADQRIRAWPIEEYEACRPFIHSVYWCYAASINVFLVVGAQDDHYARWTWRQLLEEGPKMPENLRKHQQAPGYYLDTAVKEPRMMFETWNGYDYYLAGSGKHRICIARFAAFYGHRCALHGVTVWKRYVNWELRGLWQRLREVAGERRIALTMEPYRRILSREDTAGWMKEHHEVKLRVIFEGQIRQVDTAGAFALLAALQAPRWRRWFTINHALGRSEHV